MTTSELTEFPAAGPTGMINAVHLYDVVDQTELADALTAGYVREQTHPSEPLSILNYTERCVIVPGAWNLTTLACRGLIYRSDTGEVVARGFAKFFNYGQEGAPVLDMDASVLATDKKDGSLGIIYPLPSGGWAVATRGSFSSEQALHATRVLADRYGDFKPADDVTTLVEIVYPANRIVLDYGDVDDLILLGGQPLDGSRPVPPASMQAIADWSGPVTETLMVGSFAEVLAMPDRPNAEGFVVYDLTTGALVKLKQADYVELHRIVTNLTARKVHDHLLTGKPLEDFLAPLPDEFHTWTRQVADEIRRAVHDQLEELVCTYEDAVGEVIAANPWWRDRSQRTTREGRKAYATVATSPKFREDSWALFALFDDRDICPELLKRSRPEPYLTPTGRTYTEDNA